MNKFFLVQASMAGLVAGLGLGMTDSAAAQQSSYKVSPVEYTFPGSISIIRELTVFNNDLFFRAYTENNDFNEFALFKFDGTSVSSISSTEDNYYPEDLTVFNNELFFSAKGATGRELYKFDGTNVSLVADISPGGGYYGGSRPRDLTVFNNELFFSAQGINEGDDRNPITDTELYKFDGTNVSLVADISPGRGSSYPRDLTVFNNELFFSAETKTTRRELYKFVGNRVSLVADIVSGKGFSFPEGFTVFNDELYFSATRYIGTELYKFDGTSVSLVADISPGGGYYGGSRPSDFTIFNDELFFSAETKTTGRELYKFDGTSVSLVADINPGIRYSSPYDLTVFNDELFFGAETRTTGTELYKFDGTNVDLVADIFPGRSLSYSNLIEANSSYPGEFTVFNNELFFTAEDGTPGDKLYKLSVSSTSVPEPNAILVLMGSVGAGTALKRRQKTQ